MSFRPAWWIAFVARIWPVSRMAPHAYRLPVLGRLLVLLTLPLFSPKRQNLTYVPINRDLSGEGRSMFLPREIVAGLIDRSSHRTIINQCTCRLDRGCRDHDVDIGCMLMGNGAAEIDARISRHVSKPEALSHLDRALSDGLMPLVGRAPIDNYIWGVKNRGKLLTVCFCCRCCCTILGAGSRLPRAIHESIVPASGVRIVMDYDRCTACGVCVRECFMGALSLSGQKVIRDERRCKACGRCAMVCRSGAVRLSIDHDAALVDVPRRIGRFVDFE